MVKVTQPAAMNEAFAAAFNNRSLSELLSLYEDDAVLLADGASPPRRGRQDIGEALAELIQLPGRMISRNNFCVQQGELALLRADWRVIDGQGQTVAAAGTAEIIRRQPDGRWLYVIDHAFAASLPPAAD